MCQTILSSDVALPPSRSLNPAAETFIPRDGSRHMQPKTQGPVVGECSGPTHLVGRAYGTLTPNEQFEIKKYRCGHLLCEGCGFNHHKAPKCPRLFKINTYREKHGLCLECASPQHKYSDCPKREALDRSLGRRAYDHEVRDRMLGWAYSTMTEAEKADVYDYRRRHGRCRFCGGDHQLYDCKKRDKHFKQYIARKKEDIAAGKLEIMTTFTSTLTKLPLEVRRLIWAELTKQEREVKIGRGMLNHYVYRFGFPFAEVLDAWLRCNVFHIQDSAEFKRFAQMLTTFNGFSSVHAVLFPLHSMHRHDDVCKIGSRQVIKFISGCKSLNKVKFVVDHSHLQALYSPPFFGHLDLVPAEHVLDQDIVAAIIDLSKIKHLDGVAFVDVHQFQWQRPPYPQLITKIVERVKNIFTDHGRAKVYVCGESDEELRVWDEL